MRVMRLRKLSGLGAVEIQYIRHVQVSTDLDKSIYCRQRMTESWVGKFVLTLSLNVVVS